eukprot:3773177-Lingulodinium_polyedra.AAC.1
MVEPRAARWCFRHLAAEGRSRESHFVHFRSLRGIQMSQWGMEESGQLVMVLKASDQLGPCNL